MALNARKIKGNGNMGPQQEAMEAGTYPCRVVQVIDLGIQPQRAFEGQPKPPCPHIRLTYEFTDEFCLDEKGEEMLDKPRWLSEDIPFHPLDSDLAKSTKRYFAIDPDELFGGDFTQLVGSAVNVTITTKPGSGKNKDKIYNNVASLSAMRKRDSDKCAELVNPTTVFLLDEPEKEVWAKLGSYLQDKIKEGIDFNLTVLGKLLNGEDPQAEPQPEPQPEPNVEPQAALQAEPNADASDSGDTPW